MPKKQIITIAGRPGSGKSTAAKAAAAQLGFQHFSSGDLFRSIAKDWGIDILQANLSAEQNAEIDHLVDQKIQELAASDNRLVIDSRLAWHWMPFSFKVFLNLDLAIAAERILSKLDEARLKSENIPADPSDYAKVLAERLASETRRYKMLYDADPYDMSNYDLVIDTAANNAEQTAAQIIKDYQNWLKN